MKETPFSLLTSSEIYTFNERCIQCIKESNINDNFIAQILQQIVGYIAQLVKALGRSLKSEFTPELLNSDEVRDKAFIGFRDFVKAFCNNSDKQKVKAANKLIDIIENQGWSLFKYSMSKETASLQALFGELEKPDAQSAMSTIGALPWFDDLKNAQTAFETIYQSKVAKDTEIDIPLARESVKWLRFYLKGLLNYIEINAILNPTTYKPISDKLDTIITDVTTVARARQTRKMTEKAEAKERGSTTN